jgi:hypothetical protein
MAWTSFIGLRIDMRVWLSETGLGRALRGTWAIIIFRPKAGSLNLEGFGLMIDKPDPSSSTEPAPSGSLILLQSLVPFSKGGNRLCFVHPDAADTCLKVDQDHRTPAMKRRRKGFPGNLRPLRYYDENLQECRALETLHRQYPQALTRHLPRTFGLIETDQGLAHSMDLIRDEDGLISETVERILWRQGMDPLLERALDEFRRDWLNAAPPSRDLLPHNLLLRKAAGKGTVMLVDGYGRPGGLRLPLFLRRRRALDKLQKLDERIGMVLRRKREGESPKERIGHLQRDQ